MPKRAPAELRTEAIEMRRRGITCAEVALALDVSPQAVGRWSKAASISIRTRTGLRQRTVSTCPECGKPKHHSAKTCADCKPAPLTPQQMAAQRIERMSSLELARCWPMPVAFPPIVATEPRVYEGDLST